LAQAADTGGTGAAPGAGGTGTSLGGGSGCTAIIQSTAIQLGNGWLTGLVVFLTGTPFKVAAALSFIVAALMLFLDSGHLGQHVKQLIAVVLGVALTGLVVGFLFGPQVAIAQC
jgi:hypothetical protein